MTALPALPALPVAAGAERPSGPGRALLAGTVPTPAGPVALVVTPDGVVRAAGFGDLERLLDRLSRADPAVAAGAVPMRRVATAELPPEVVDALLRYGSGEAGALDVVPVVQPGGAFYQETWLAMRRVPPGSTVTYAELAAMAGRPAAVRAVGTACARNLVAPFVPCHRIVRSDGTLGGYAYGLDVKQALLTHERALTADGRPPAGPGAPVPADAG